jgi:hypothetical protein
MSVLHRKWECEGEEIKKLQSRTRLRRVLGSKKDAKAMADHLETIDHSIRQFLVRHGDTCMLLTSFTFATARKRAPDRG